MAAPNKITIRVSTARRSVTVAYATTGRYGGLTTGGINRTLQLQPLPTGATADAYWLEILALVQADLTALESGS